ncbi:MAG: hypothetical protein ACOX50_04310 [Patescibacteria group bacterium]|jgi:uncharacterized protein YaiL (DUF2058 family)
MIDPERIRAEIERIKREAAEKMAAKKAAEMRAEINRLEEQKRARELFERENRIKSFLKGCVIETFTSIYREFPELNLTIIPFTKKLH